LAFYVYQVTLNIIEKRITAATISMVEKEEKNPTNRAVPIACAGLSSLNRL